MAPLDNSLREVQLEAAGPDIVAEDFGGEIVVLNLANGRYFSLPGISAGLWRDLAEGCTPASLMELAAAAGPAALTEAVESIVAGLVAEGLLRPRTVPVANPAPKVVFAGTEALPVLESYDDMADLILADPIHDVDENIGWPVKKEDVPGA
ncbi:MAG: PqqD family protein [Bauldia sp.]|nr:PqqD family protein [Bauldia sp.]